MSRMHRVNRVKSYDGIERTRRFNNAFKSGWRAAADGLPRSRCPYKGDTFGSRSYRNAWIAGHEWGVAHPESH